MLKAIRYLLAISFLIIAIYFFKNRTAKLKPLKIISCTIAFIVILMMPFENLFLKFNTPETAFKYTTNNCDIIKVVKSDQTALIIYLEKSSTYATIFSKSGGKWKAPFWPDKQSILRLENGEIVLVTKEPKSNNFYIMITTSSDVKLVSDNQNSNFEIFLENDYWTHYVAYVDNNKGDYIINIDGDQYKIEI